MIHCGNNFSGKIIIVTRDSDYGTTIDNHSFLNDHLLQEYHERVGSKRMIKLTNKLSEALKELDIKITKEEETAESTQIITFPKLESSDFYKYLDKSPISSFVYTYLYNLSKNIDDKK